MPELNAHDQLATLSRSPTDCAWVQSCNLLLLKGLRHLLQPSSLSEGM